MANELVNGLTLSEFSCAMEVNGGLLFEQVVPELMCERMKDDIFFYYEKNRELQIAAGLGEVAQWAAHHTCGRKDSIHDFLKADYLHYYLTEYFGGKPYILNAINASINAPIQNGIYEHAHKWHRDIRSYVSLGERQMVIALIMLDDFTIENGATQVVFGTHRTRHIPPEDFLLSNAKSVSGKRGSIIFYDGDIVHRAGINLTEHFRVGLTCLFTKPYYKQQLDYPRFLDKEYADSLSTRMRQLFGFNARVPVSMEEWYHPSGRFYKADQE